MTLSRPSMRDVALRAGVSGQTVSRVVNEHTNVEDDTRERVLAAMAELGYRPNRAARALRTGRSHAIGAVISTLTSVGNSRLLEAVTAAASAHGYVVIVQALGESPIEADIAAAIENLIEHGVDGVIMANEAARWVANERGAMPLVLLDAAQGTVHDAVMSDHQAGARLIVERLRGVGLPGISGPEYVPVHHIAGPADSFASQERERAWREVAGAGVAGDSVPEPERGDWTAAAGYEAGRALMRRRAAGEDVQAIFAANDQMALGAMRAIRESGLRIPEDVAVAGFDGNPDSAFASPPLTTVAQDFDALAAAAMTMLMNPRSPSQARRIVIPPTLQGRASG